MSTELKEENTLNKEDFLESMSTVTIKVSFNGKRRKLTEAELKESIRVLCDYSNRPDYEL